MELLVTLVIPIAVILLNYVQKRAEKRMQEHTYQEFVEKFAKDVLASINSLPKGN